MLAASALNIISGGGYMEIPTLCSSLTGKESAASQYVMNLIPAMDIAQPTTADSRGPGRSKTSGSDTSST